MRPGRASRRRLPRGGARGQAAGRLPRDGQGAARPMEGFLFPATYQLARPVSATRLVAAAADGVPRASARVDFRVGRQEEPDALRRPHHRLDDRARGGLSGRPRQDRGRDLQPPARRHAARHRRDDPVRASARGACSTRATCASRAATTRARTAGCRRRRSAIPASPRCGRPRIRPHVPYLYYVAIPGDTKRRHHFSKTYADFQHFQQTHPA